MTASCVELWDHGDPLDSARNDALARWPLRPGVALVATNNVHYATPAAPRLATALAAVRARRSLDEIDGWLPAGAGAHLRSGAEQARASPATRARSSAAAEVGRGCAFDLALVAPRTCRRTPCPRRPRRDDLRSRRRSPTATAAPPSDRLRPPALDGRAGARRT